jgi:hypothetical protein
MELVLIVWPFEFAEFAEMVLWLVQDRMASDFDEDSFFEAGSGRLKGWIPYRKILLQLVPARELIIVSLLSHIPRLAPLPVLSTKTAECFLLLLEL